MRSGQDSRWYSGAGLHRPVVLHVDEPVLVVPDGVSVTTVRVEDDQAVVDVVTTVANAGLTTQTMLDRLPGSGTNTQGPDSVWNSVEQFPWGRVCVTLSVKAD